MDNSDLSRRGFTLVELLVVITIIGILIALLLPAVQAAREAARRMDCSNKLRQIGLAMHNYHASHKVFPPGAISKIPRPPGAAPDGTIADQGAPWSVLILPFLEQMPLYKEFNFSGSFSSRLGDRATNGSDDGTGRYPDGPQFVSLPPFQCPSDPASGPDETNSNYFGCSGGGLPSEAAFVPTGSAGRVFFENGVYYINSKVKIAHITDGTSNVFLAGETRYCNLRQGATNPSYNKPGDQWTWASTVQIRQGGVHCFIGCCASAVDQINTVLQLLDGSDWDPRTTCWFTPPMRIFGSYHPGGCHMMMADSSVHFFSENMDLRTFQTLGARDDAMPLGGSAFD